MIGLAVLVVTALGIVFAGPAQAASPEWSIEGSQLTGSESISGSGESITINVPGTVKIPCSSSSATGGSIGPLGQTSGPVLTFSGCKVIGAPACKVFPITTVHTSWQLTQVGEKLYELIKPSSGTAFTSIQIAGCAASGSWTVVGTMGAEVEPAGVELNDQPLRFSGAAQSAVGAVMHLMGRNGLVEGTLDQELTGVNAGRKWGAR